MSHKLKIVVVLSLVCLCSIAFAQPIRVTVDKFPNRAFGNPSFKQTKRTNFRTESTALTLPFWEDFSDTASLGNNFKPNTGIYFNNNLCINQPSVNVATFDGLDGKGNPYSPNNPYKNDMADSLVSLDIDLSSLNPKDSSLYFSFLYQMAGYGEMPDSLDGDSLILLFYTKQGNWKSVWHSSFRNASDTSVFNPVLFKIVDSSYFHPNFKFKFFNYGNLSGMFDLWHVDYIVMDTVKSGDGIREIKDGRMYFSDQAISKSPTSIVTPYLSIPVNHIKSFPFGSSFDFTISNLSLNQNTVESFYILEKEDGLGTTQDPISPSVSTDINSGIFKATQPFSTSITPDSSDFKLVNKVFLNKTFADTLNYFFSHNDTVTSVFPFSDYYAYDDGTYEYGVRFDQVNALQAVAYDSYQSDTLTDIDMSIPHIGYDIAGVNMYIKIWADNNGKPGRELYSQREEVVYIDTLGINPFTRYNIDSYKTVVVNGRFYIGFQQLSGNKKAIKIGFDVNNNRKDKFWYDNTQGSGWSQYRNLNGAMMIRPVFRNNAKNISVAPSLRTEDNYELVISPNPNTGILNLNGIHDKVLVSDMRGSVWITSENAQTIDLSGLSPGIYIVQSFLNGRSSYKRLDYQGN